jgi:hypothetical protein
MTFEDLFRSHDAARDSYLARLFGMISEEVLRIWAADERAAYRNLGRPTLYDGIAFATLDFTLESRADGRRYIAEQKAELAFERYRYLRLTSAAQVEHHRANRAFSWFLDAALNPADRVVKVAAKPIEVAGAILVWGATTPEGCNEAMTTLGFADVLSVEAMLADLRAWRDPTWAARIEQLRAWTNELLDGLR